MSSASSNRSKISDVILFQSIRTDGEFRARPLVTCGELGKLGYGARVTFSFNRNWIMLPNQFIEGKYSDDVRCICFIDCVPRQYQERVSL